MKISKTAKTTSLILGIALSIFAINFVALAFVGPPGDPTYCPSGHIGCDVPLHEGIEGQIKEGPLGIEGVLRAYSNLIVDGNVGIGTDNPSSALHVKGDIQDLLGPLDTGVHIGTSYSIPLIDLVTNGISQLSFSSEEIFGKGYINYDAASDRMIFGTASNEKMRITHDGNVGIGTASPSQELHVAGNMRLTGHFYDVNNSAGSDNQVLTRTSSGPAWQSVSGHTHSWASCSWTSYTCNASQTCSSGYYVAGVDRYTTGSLCGSGSTMWYQMRLYCCQVN